MELLFSTDAILEKIGQYISQGELRNHVLKLLLTMIFMAIIWPYFADSAYYLWHALAWNARRAPQMNEEIRERYSIGVPQVPQALAHNEIPKF